MVAWGSSKTPIHIECSIEISVECCLAGRGTAMGFLHRRSAGGTRIGADGCPMDRQRRIFGIRVVETTQKFPHLNWSRMEPRVIEKGIAPAAFFFFLCPKNYLPTSTKEGIIGKRDGAARLYPEPIVPSSARSHTRTPQRAHATARAR